MTEKKVKIKRPLYKRILRVLFIVVLIFLFLFSAVVLLIQTAPVQNFLRGKAVSYLHSKIHTRVEVGRIYIGFPKNIVIENVFLEDEKHDTLISAGKLSVNISMWKLLHGEVEISNIDLKQATVKIKRLLPDTAFNFQFIVNAFSSQGKKEIKKDDTSSTKISLKNISFDNIRAVYDDVITGNDIDVSLTHLDIHVNELDLKNQYYEVPEINIKGLRGKVYQNNPLVIYAIKDTSSNSAVSSLPSFKFKNIALKNIALDYRNNPSALFIQLNVGDLAIDARTFDLNKRIINLDKLELSATTASVRLGKSVNKNEDVKKASVNTTDSSGWRIMVKELALDNNNIGFDDDNVPRQKKGIDYSHIKSNGTTFHISNLLVSNDSIAGDISKGSLVEQSGFKLQLLEGNFLYSKNQSYLKNFRIQTPGTLLQRSLVLNYPSIGALKKNMRLLLLDVHLRNSKIQVKDILIFVPSLDTMAALKNPNAVFAMNTGMKGSLGNLKIKELQFTGLQNTKIDVSGHIKGLPDIKSLQTNLVIKTISSSRSDILNFIPEKELPSNIAIPKQFELSGKLNGNMQNLVTDLVLNTSSGKATVKGSFKNLNDAKNIGYDAAITTQDLNLGYILKDDSTYGNVSLRLKVVGKGTDPKSANANVDGTIQSAFYKKYNYKDALIKASIANQIAKADISIHDPNIYFSLNGSADLSTKYPAIKFTSVIDSIKTKPLHFTADDIAYYGKIDADFPISDPDNLKGNLLIENSLLVKNGKKIKLDTIKLASGQTDSGQYLRLFADVITAQLNGHYKLTEIGTVFNQLIEPYFSTVHSDKKIKTSPYDFSIALNIRNGAILKELLPTLERLDPIRFQGKFNSEKGWNADLNSPLIIYGDMRVQDFQLHAKPESNKLALQTTLQQFTSGKTLVLYNTSLNTSIADNKIDFALNVQDKSSKDKYHIGGLVQSKNSGEYLFSLKPEKLLLNYNKWNIASDNQIEYSSSKLLAHDFNLSRGTESLNIYSSTTEVNAPLEISFNKFLLSTLTGFAGTDSLLANGELSGKIAVKNIQIKPTFISDLKINNLSVYKDTVGDITLKVSNTAENKFSANVNITGHGNDIALNGDYYVKPDNNSNFNLILDMKKLDLSSIVGVSAGALKNASGSLNGKIALNGTLDKPNINGNIAFNNAQLNPAMLNSNFFVDGQKFEIDNDGFNFDNFTILDSSKNKLVLDGNVKTKDYKRYDFDLSINAKNFQALNSTKRDNKLYYGRLFFNTNLNIKGTDLQPSVDGTFHITNKTKLTVVIPQEEPGVEERQGIVRFVDMKTSGHDSILNLGYDSIGKSSLRGFDISTNIIVDSSAELTLVVDESNGDHLTVQGTANLTGGIDRSGNTTLSGRYQLTHGSYDLTFSVLHKKFDIQSGSTITWTGEPTKADLNINAIYTSNTAPIDLVSDQIQNVSNTNNYQQKLPFYVYLKMTGELLKPQISFDIVLPDDKAYSVSKEVVTTVQSKLQMIRQDQGEMNKQVFALLLLGRFVGEDPFASNAAALNAESLVRQSVSKILSQQLNQLAANLVHGVDISFDLQSTDDYTTGQLQNRTDLNVAISKQLLNDRLRVTVGSNFELEGPQNVNANQQSNNLAGNIALDYKLSKDGKYLLRAYRRNDYDDVIEGYVIETGLGFVITVDYNHFRELFQNKKKKQKSLEKKKTTSDKDDKSVLAGGKKE